jgi:hypothetical protein
LGGWLIDVGVCIWFLSTFKPGDAMNEKLEKFAKQAKLLKSTTFPDLRLVDDDELEHFAELVRQEEREACAKTVDGLTGRSYEFDLGRLHSAAAIRSRDNHGQD